MGPRKAVKLAGLAGGIGCGKSTVASFLVTRGAVAVDVDLVSRELQQPGQPVFEAMLRRWGNRILTESGTLDRQAVAGIVFDSKQEMDALMAMTSPAIEDRLHAVVKIHHGTDDVVLLESALLVSSPRRYGMTGLLVVDAPEDAALERLVHERGMSEADARARMGNQMARDLRLQRADFVIDNSGPRAALEHQIGQAWDWLRSQPDGMFRVEGG
jgi:dephospho-CoA kinase